VNALDQPCGGAGQVLPALARVRLADYKVRILNTPVVRPPAPVLIESTDGQQEWGTVGVHDNIIEASLQALSDSLEYGCRSTPCPSSPVPALYADLSKATNPKRLNSTGTISGSARVFHRRPAVRETGYSIVIPRPTSRACSTWGTS